jgi:hypothetical protein
VLVRVIELPQVVVVVEAAPLQPHLDQR